MNYYGHFAAQTIADGLKRPYVYLLSVFFSLLAVLLMKSIGAAGMPAAAADYLGMALIFNGLLPVCYISIYLSAQQVFFREKKQKTLTMVLCSPAGLAEVFWGKAAGLFVIAFAAPSLVMLAAVAGLTPQELAAMASWKALAALGMTGVMAMAYTVVLGIALLSVNDERIVSVVLYGFTAAQFGLAKLTRAAAGGSLFKGVLFQYGMIMTGFVLIAAAAYSLYFSKLRVVESA